MASLYYLCLDCGGTKAAAALASSTGEVIARGYAGPANYKDIGLDAFLSSVKEASNSALSVALSPSVTLPSPSSLFAAVWIGASGIDSPSDIKILTPILSELFGVPIGRRLIISNDSHLLAAPLRLFKDVSTALVTIAGTGTVVVSFGTRSEDGGLQELARAGGWGWLLGDEGSAFHVGREAIRHILQEFDQNALSSSSSPSKPSLVPTLRDRILAHFDINSPDELFSVVYATDPRPSPSSPLDNKAFHLTQERKFRLSGLSPLVFESAFDDGDEMALSVLRNCSSSLAESACSLLQLSGSTPVVGREKAILASETVLCLGGSLVGVAKYKDLYLEAFKRNGHIFKHIHFVEDAAEGGAKALWGLFAV